MFETVTLFVITKCSRNSTLWQTWR